MQKQLRNSKRNAEQAYEFGGCMKTTKSRTRTLAGITVSAVMLAATLGMDAPRKFMKTQN